jgi:hypothetical protein
MAAGWSTVRVKLCTGSVKKLLSPGHALGTKKGVAEAVRGDAVVDVRYREFRTTREGPS